MAFQVTKSSRFHEIIWMPIFPTGTRVGPVIFVDQAADAQPGVLPEALTYFREQEVRRKSASWQQKAAADIGMFYEFYRATNSSTEGQTHANNLVAHFLCAAIDGTIRLDGSDPSGLYWTALSNKRASVLRKNLRFFLRFLADLFPENPLSATRFANCYISAYALEQKKRKGLLYHIGERDTPGASRNFDPVVGMPKMPVKKFPRNKLVKLVLEGCRLARRRNGTGSRLANEYNITMVMALSLIIGGGIRRSELFHIWVDDVQPASGSVGKVYLYHPEEGVVSKGLSRKNLLLSEYKRVPRNTLGIAHKEHAGWKELLEDDQQLRRSEIYWCDPFWRELFFRTFVEYRDEIRPDRPGHPYLFVSLSDATFGEPWTVGAFNQSFRAALERIGLRPDRHEGLNPHGIRHSYGQYLRNLNLDPQFIQRAMHHRSPLSQAIYTAPEAFEVDEAIQAARKRVNAEEPLPVQSNDAFDLALIASKDPAGVLAAWGWKR